MAMEYVDPETRNLKKIHSENHLLMCSRPHEAKKYWIGHPKIRDEGEDFDLAFKVEVPNDSPVRT